MNFKRITLFFLLFSFFSLSSQAQVTEIDIKLQEIFLKGSQARLMGDNEKAAEFYKQVLAKDPTNATAAFELARALQEENKDEEAIKYAKKAVQSDGSNNWYKFFLGDLYQKTNKNGEAASLYQGLVTANPEYEEYYLKWAFFLVRDGNSAKAVEVYNQLEQRIGVNEELTRRKHSLYLGTGDTKNAAAELEKLVGAFPKSTTYRHLLADFYQQIDDRPNANKIYKKILELDPEDASAKLALAGTIKKSGNDSQYLQTLQPLFAKRNVDLDVKIKELIPIIQKVANSGDAALADEALQLCNTLKEAHPDQAKVYAIEGDLYYHTNRPADAEKSYQKTIELDDTVYLVWESLLLSQKEQGKFKELVATSEKAMDVFPNQGQVYFLNGFAEGALKNYSAALSSLQQAQMMSTRNLPLHLDVLARQGWTYMQMKKLDKAANVLAKANGKSGGKHTVVLEVMGDVLFKQGKTKDAVQSWKDALKIYGDSRPELEQKIANKSLN